MEDLINQINDLSVYDISKVTRIQALVRGYLVRRKQQPICIQLLAKKIKNNKEKEKYKNKIKIYDNYNKKWLYVQIKKFTPARKTKIPYFYDEVLKAFQCIKQKSKYNITDEVTKSLFVETLKTSKGMTYDNSYYILYQDDDVFVTNLCCLSTLEPLSSNSVGTLYWAKNRNPVYRSWKETLQWYIDYLCVGVTKSNKEKVESEFMPNEDGFSDWKDVSAFKELTWGNNGHSRQGTFFGVKHYIWEKYPAHGKIEKLRLCGFSQTITSNRPIRKEIREHYLKSECVNCGSGSDLIIDHKNDLYNDPRVLCAETQEISDFQTLCNSCNLKKRAVSTKVKETNKRIGATTIPMLEPFNVDFIGGNENLDLSDPNAMVGTFWYDPVKFTEFIKKHLQSK